MARTKIMLIGCTESVGCNINEYEDMAQFALQHGYFPVIPMKLFPEKVKFAEYYWLRVVGAELLKCDEIITLHDWEQAPVNAKLIQMANMVDIPVTHFSRFLQRESTHKQENL